MRGSKRLLKVLVNHHHYHDEDIQRWSASEWSLHLSDFNASCSVELQGKMWKVAGNGKYQKGAERVRRIHVSRGEGTLGPKTIFSVQKGME